LHLGAADIGVAVQHLPLQVGILNHVPVDHSDGSDTSRRQVKQSRRAEPARADHQHSGLLQRLLPRAADLFDDYDLILDGTDNFDTRYLANATAAAQGKPLISGALSQWEGQLSVFDPARGTPCYECLFPEAPAPGLAPSCAEAGVLGPLPGVVGAMMAVEAVKLISGAGQCLRGEMLIYDALYGETRKIGLQRRADCPVCGEKGEKDDQPLAG
jgi:molybdopterin/thiamine biosynthesis adenylyltransferase